MSFLMEIKEKLKGLYGEYSMYALPILKFGLAMIVFTMINNNMGYLQSLNSLPILIVLAAVSAILPLNGMVIIGMFLIIAHSFGLGIEIGAVSTILYMVIALVYFRLAPNDALVLILSPLACSLNIPAVIPLSLGLFRGPQAAISAVFGVFSWQYLHGVVTEIAPLKTSGTLSQIALLQKIPTLIMGGHGSYLYMVAFAATTIIVSVICRFATKYTREIALISGMAGYLAVMIGGGIALKAEMNPAAVIVGTLVSGVIAYVIDFFIYSVDYEKTKYIQFEDENYYYYVKAIPKLHSDGIHEEEFENEVEAFKGIKGRQNAGNAGAESAGMNPAQAEKEVDFEERLTDSLKDL
ncbi:MAG TPA: hypothetical protein DCM49_03285 [Lachnospiraceae bacterium]|nr:hypothetical protein [Lachnospiraceae bacterium]